MKVPHPIAVNSDTKSGMEICGTLPSRGCWLASLTRGSKQRGKMMVRWCHPERLNGKGASVPVRGRYKRFELKVHITQVLYDWRWQLKVRQHVVDELVVN